jgi:hypothetical protein
MAVRKRRLAAQSLNRALNGYSRRGRDGEPLPEAQTGNQREAAYEHPAHGRRALNSESKLGVSVAKMALGGAQ